MKSCSKVLLAFLKNCSNSSGLLDCWASQRDISIGKLVSFATANLYNVCTEVIKPLTCKDRCSYVEAIAESEHAQVPSWFVSHWWGEPVADFVTCIEGHRSTRGLSRANAYWVCAYANNQHEVGDELGIDPKQSSFYKAMQICVGVLLILDELGPATPFQRIWCCFEEAIAVSDFGGGEDHHLLLDISTVRAKTAELITDGLTDTEAIMEQAHSVSAVNPSGWGAKSQREASFPISIIREGLQVSICEAKASLQSDWSRILNSIAEKDKMQLDLEPNLKNPVYDEVNRSLRSIFAVAAWRQVIESEEDAGPLKKVLQEDSRRKDLKLHFAGSKLDSRGLKDVADSIPVGLRSISIDCSECKIFTESDMNTLNKIKGVLQRFDVNACGTMRREDLLLVLTALPGFSDHHIMKLLDAYDRNRGGHVNYTEFLEWLLEDPFRNLGNALTMAPLLRKVEFVFSSSHVLTTIGGLVCGLPHLHNLTRLKLDLQKCTALRCIEDLGVALKALKVLESLDLSFMLCSKLKSIDALGRGLRGAQSLANLRLDFQSCKALTDITELGHGLATLKALSELEINFARCPALAVDDIFWKSFAPLKSITSLDLNFAHCCGIFSLVELSKALTPGLIKTKMNFYYCASLSPHVQWCFKSVDAFKKAVAKGGRGIRYVRGTLGDFEADEEEEGEEDDHLAVNFAASAGATSKTLRARLHSED